MRYCARAREIMGRDTDGDSLGRARGASTHAPLALLASALLHSIEPLMVKALKSRAGVRVEHVLVMRGAVQTALALSTLVLQRAPRSAFVGSSRAETAMLAFRGLFGCLAVAFMTNAVTLLPLGEASTLGQTRAIWAALLGSCVLGERWHRGDAGATAVALCGVALIMQPRIALSALDALGVTELSAGAPPGGESGATPGGAAHALGCALALLAAVSSAICFVLLRWQGRARPSAHLATPILWQGVCIAALPAVPAALRAEPPVLLPRAPWAALTLCSVGLGSFGVQVLLTYGVRRVPPGTSALLKASETVYSFAWQALFFPTEADARTTMVDVGGALLVVGALAHVTRMQVRRARAGESEPALDGGACGWRGLASGRRAAHRMADDPAEDIAAAVEPELSLPRAPQSRSVPVSADSSDGLLLGAVGPSGPPARQPAEPDGCEAVHARRGRGSDAVWSAPDGDPPRC